MNNKDKKEQLEKSLKDLEDNFTENVESIKKQLEDLDKDVVEPLTSGYYRHPVNGSIWVHGNGFSLKEVESLCKKGKVFKTFSQCEVVNRTITESFMIAQYLYSKEPDYVPDWKDRTRVKWFVDFDHNTGKYDTNYHNNFESTGQVVMPKHVADQLVEELNNGTYSLEGFK